jgi:hypothetical protein
LASGDEEYQKGYERKSVLAKTQEKEKEDEGLQAMKSNSYTGGAAAATSAAKPFAPSQAYPVSEDCSSRVLPAPPEVLRRGGSDDDPLALFDAQQREEEEEKGKDDAEGISFTEQRREVVPELPPAAAAVVQARRGGAAGAASLIDEHAVTIEDFDGI